MKQRKRKHRSAAPSVSAPPASGSAGPARTSTPPARGSATPRLAATRPEAGQTDRPPTRGGSSPFRWRGAALVAAQIVLLAGVTVAAYGPALHGGFIWDDDKYVVDNATLRTSHGLWCIWTKPCSIPQWYPLVHTSFWVEYHIWKVNPLPYHVNNVLLHIGGALLFWLVLRRLGLRGGAYAAALLFAVHPVMVESAGWITERKNVLSLAFYLGALLAYFRFDPFFRDGGPSVPRGGASQYLGCTQESGVLVAQVLQPVQSPTMHSLKSCVTKLPDTVMPPPRRWPFLALAVFLYLCALLCKTVTFTLPVVLLLLIWWKSGRAKGAWTLLLTPLILAPAVFVIRFWAPTGSFRDIPDTASLLETFRAWCGTSRLPTRLLPWAGLGQAAILAFFWFIRRSVPWRRAACLLPMLAVGAGFGFVTAWLENHHVGAEGLEWEMNGLGHVLLAARIAWFYGCKLLWPAPIMFFYPRWAVDPRQGWQYLYPAAAGGLVAALWVLRNRIGRGPLAAVLCFGVTIFAALGFSNVYPMQFSYVADHFQYHASLAIFALGAGAAAALVGRWAGPGAGAGRRRRWGVSLAAGACLLGAAGLLARGAWRQGHDYKDLKTLWTNTLEKNPRCWIAMNNLATVRMAEDKDNIYALNTTAIPLIERALIVYSGGDPDRVSLGGGLPPRALIAQAGGDPNRIYENAMTNLGFICLKKGHWTDANEYFHEAMATRPADADLRNWLGKIIFEGGRTQEALAYFREAQAINPNNASAYHNIGSVLEQLHLRPEAMASYEKAIALNPDKPEPHISLGRLLLPTDAQGALREFRRALEGNPDSVRAMDNIVWALNSLDRPLEALQAARNALATDANLPASLAIAAGILSTYPDANVRDGRRAVEYANRLCRNTNRSDVAALDILAEAYAEAGLYNQAVAADQEAINLALANRWPELTDQYRQHQQQFRENKPLRRSGGR